VLIAQISDTHLALDTPDAARRTGDLERTISDINALDPLPDVIVHTGDVVHNGRADEYETVTKILSKARPPVYAIVGNKDNRNAFQTAFSSEDYLSSKSPFVTYAIDEYPLRLVMLDTLDTQSNKGDFCIKRAELLASMLQTHSDKPTAVFAHHPPFEILVGPEPWNFGTEEAMARLCNGLEKSDQIVGLFCGHVHRATTGWVGKIPATVIPSIATTLRWGDYPEPIQTRPIYYLHHYDATWGFSTTARIV